MTRSRVQSLQAAIPLPGVRMVRVKITVTSPLTVELPGGGTAVGVAVEGLTYTVDAAAWALVQEPAVGPVFPIA